MPQLDPGPWLSTMLISWVTLIFVILPKMLELKFTHDPTPRWNRSLSTQHWNWTWS